ncbi:ankyrin [Astrocystis sublimbata]|nr:ankyrin [Astrocystis sublimbata]
MQLATQWRVPDTAQSITFALKGNIDGLKDLFSRGLASPWDMSDSRGFSLIRWALYGGMHQYKTVHFLISQGAHVDDEKHVFDFGFRKKCSDTELMALSCIRYSRDRNWIEDQHFPLLHQIIIGLSSQSLVAVLKDNPNAAHATDAQGRTALDWAAARAQLSHMRLLIEHKSNVNAMDARGRTTILHAVDSHVDEAVRILLEAGANPNPKIPAGLFRSSPLKAASFGGLVKMVKLLLDFGAEIDAYSPEGQTALHAAIITQNVKCAGLLLEYGASLGDVAHNGRTPLTTAMIHNSHAVLKLLVNQRYEHVTALHVNGPQVLAVLAEYADEETMSIIASSLPLKLSLGLGEDGFTADREILWQRREYGAKLECAFENLLSSIIMAKQADGGV